MARIRSEWTRPSPARKWATRLAIILVPVVMADYAVATHFLNQKLALDFGADLWVPFVGISCNILGLICAGVVLRLGAGRQTDMAGAATVIHAVMLAPFVLAWLVLLIVFP